MYNVTTPTTGGVRRSALICLSDLHDQAMRTCKSGAWWEAAPFRALANVSAVYDQRPSRKEFDEEWAALRASGSGERGIFSRSACMDKVQSLPHRSGANNDGSTIAFGTNPCSEIILRPFQFCNLTEVCVMMVCSFFCNDVIPVNIHRWWYVRVMVLQNCCAR